MSAATLTADKGNGKGAATMVTLPITKSGPVHDAERITILIYGTHGIGKSTWCAEAPEALMIATEPGLNHLTAYKHGVESWEGLLATCAALAKGGLPYKTIVLDTVDNALVLCRAFIQERYGIQDLSEDNNKGYALVNNEFQRVLTKLALLPYGLILVSHAQDVEMKTRTRKYTKTVPTLSAKARQIVLQLVDVVLYADIEVTAGEDERSHERRVLFTKPTSEYEAKDRTGLLPDTLPLSYAAFLNAWNAAKNGADTDPQPKKD